MFATEYSFCAMAQSTIEPGSVPVMTLTLDVAGVPGTYSLSFVNGFFDTADNGTWPIVSGEALKIEVK